jgi:hypothetical protein
VGGGGSLPGAVGTRGGVGAPPTAYQPHGRGASKPRPYKNKKGRSSESFYELRRGVSSFRSLFHEADSEGVLL